MQYGKNTQTNPNSTNGSSGEAGGLLIVAMLATVLKCSDTLS